MTSTRNNPKSSKQKGRVSIDVTGQASQGEAPASPEGRRRTTVVRQDVSGLREQIIGKFIGSALTHNMTILIDIGSKRGSTLPETDPRGHSQS